MSFIEDMDVTLVDIPMMYLLSVRKNVLKNDYETEYMKCFGQLFRRIANEKLTLAAPPMVLFHGSEHTPQGCFYFLWSAKRISYLMTVLILYM